MFGVDEVYPRVGGETTNNTIDYDACTGLSPRGRGNLEAQATAGPILGSIPAWAGKPATGWIEGLPGRVYPRVGGETWFLPGPTSFDFGLSPRGRGNRPEAGSSLCQTWSIPAWAGKPTRLPPARRRVRVYPRVGGETLQMGAASDKLDGLSPRGRGNQRQRGRLATLQGSIPAWAGKPGAGIPFQ